MSYLLADVIREHLLSVQDHKRSYKDDKRYGVGRRGSKVGYSTKSLQPNSRRSALSV